ncbi:interferon-inducible GTPase 5-like [Plectropomus leopardus]|uniref:interferon-inducible GTPase 5-like n=1 Tax=Plectropomus leopardus TaxID=160734 RepID=UPI001C4AC75F|nr:interferon-inducible GTPase 5-like [Plectropomus leopardus]
MEDPTDCKSTEDIKNALKSNNPALAVKMIQRYLEKENDHPLNIAVTGEYGSGKSTFVNAFRGIDHRDERAAPTGFVETTSEVTEYLHPNYPHVTLWDLPGIGTTLFPADKFLELVEFEKFDFFIIISETRLKENDVKLALEVQRMGKKFYFLRSKTDNDLLDEERRHKSKFNTETTLKQIKEDCIQGLQKQGVVSPQVFLVSNFRLQLYDFPLLVDTFERELPAHRRNALLLAMPNINLEVINQKKKAFSGQIKYYALLGLGVAAVRVPGLSVAVHVGMLVYVVKKYVNVFGLDTPSLQRLAECINVPVDDLLAVKVSPFAAPKLTPALVLKLLSQFAGTAVLLAAVEGSRFIPTFGIPAAMSLSFMLTYRALKKSLDMLTDDAERVFKRALGLNT